LICEGSRFVAAISSKLAGTGARFRLRRNDGNQFRVHKHVELTADCRGTISTQAVKIMHHVHLIVIAKSMGNICPLRRGCCRLTSEGRLEPDDSGVQLGRDSDLVAKAPLELMDSQACVVCKMGHRNPLAPRYQRLGCLRSSAESTDPRPVSRRARQTLQHPKPQQPLRSWSGLVTVRGVERRSRIL
jgi:hypothetical protein